MRRCPAVRGAKMVNQRLATGFWVPQVAAGWGNRKPRRQTMLVTRHLSLPHLLAHLALGCCNSGVARTQTASGAVRWSTMMDYVTCLRLATQRRMATNHGRIQLSLSSMGACLSLDFCKSGAAWAQKARGEMRWSMRLNITARLPSTTQRRLGAGNGRPSIRLLDIVRQVLYMQTKPAKAPRRSSKQM